MQNCKKWKYQSSYIFNTFVDVITNAPQNVLQKMSDRQTSIRNTSYMSLEEL